MPAKKKTEKPEDLMSRLAQLTGTISRVYGILRLEAKDNTMAGRWGAVEDWCKEQERIRNASMDKGLVEGNGADGA
jgi:hypothetical protein